MSLIAEREHDHYLFYFFLSILIWAPIPLGSNRPWSSMLLVFLLASLCFFWLILYLNNRVSISAAVYRARWAIVSLAFFQLWVLSQSINFPQALVTFLSPNIATQYQLAGFNEARYISLNVDNSLKTGVLGLGLLLSFIMALLLITTKERKHIFYITLVVSGTVQAFYGVILVFIDSEMLLKFETFFHMHKTSASGTFVNSNHFAGYLNICLAIGVGLLLSQLNHDRHETWRSFFRATIATLLSSKVYLRIFLMIMVIGLLVSRSRMGNSAFFAALTLSTLFYLVIQKKFNVKVILFFLSLMLIDTFLVGTWFGLDKVVQEVQNTSLSNDDRTDINANSFVILKQFMPMGAGAGAYKFVEPGYNFAPSEALTEHAHNDYFEFLIDTGLVGVGCLLLFLYFVIKEISLTLGKNQSKQKSKHARSLAASFGLIMLLVYVAIHSSVDFNLQIPAFSFTLLTCLAMAFVNSSEINQRESFAGSEGNRHVV